MTYSSVAIFQSQVLLMQMLWQYLEESEVDIQRFLHNLDSNGEMIGLSSYIDEIKVTTNFAIKVSLDGETIEQVGKFFCFCLTFVVNKINCSEKIVSWIVKASTPFTCLRKSIFTRKTSHLRQRCVFLEALSSYIAQSLQLYLLKIY